MHLNVEVYCLSLWTFCWISSQNVHGLITLGKARSCMYEEKGVAAGAGAGKWPVIYSGSS
jgi:hypothetical protein